MNGCDGYFHTDAFGVRQHVRCPRSTALWRRHYDVYSRMLFYTIVISCTTGCTMDDAMHYIFEWHQVNGSPMVQAEITGWAQNFDERIGLPYPSEWVGWVVNVPLYGVAGCCNVHRPSQARPFNAFTCTWDQVHGDGTLPTPDELRRIMDQLRHDPTNRCRPMDGPYLCKRKRDDNDPDVDGHGHSVAPCVGVQGVPTARQRGVSTDGSGKTRSEHSGGYYRVPAVTVPVSVGLCAVYYGLRRCFVYMRSKQVVAHDDVYYDALAPDERRRKCKQAHKKEVRRARPIGQGKPVGSVFKYLRSEVRGSCYSPALSTIIRGQPSFAFTYIAGPDHDREADNADSVFEAMDEGSVSSLANEAGDTASEGSVYETRSADFRTRFSKGKLLCLVGGEVITSIDTNKRTSSYQASIIWLDCEEHNQG